MSKCFVIADVAQAHDGSLGMAHAFIDSVARTGADAIKFQMHIASEESTLAETWRVKFSYQDDTRMDYWRRMEFTESQWIGLKKHTEEAGLQFICSPFSLKSVDILSDIGVYAWKIASGEVNNEPLFERMAATHLPFILSTGMSSFEEIDSAVEKIKQLNLPLTVLQCTTEYPTPPEKTGLNMLSVFRERYGCSVGLSDHSGCIYPGLAAATLGAEVVEVHIALSREMFGPDVSSSLTPAELKQMVDGIRFIETMLDNPVDKDKIADEKRELRTLFGKSVVAATDLSAGIVITDAHLGLKKPGTGLPPNRMKEIIGRRLVRPLLMDEQIRPEDYE